MKFRARLSAENASVFHGIAATLEKIATTASIFLNEECIRIAVLTENPDTPRCYSEILPGELFMDYRIESQSGNQILFQISMEHLAKALSSSKSGTSQLKLVKRGATACLCFEAKDCDSLVAGLSHDIPIKLLKPADIVYYMPPEVPPPLVALDLPKNNKLMQTIVTKMGKISKHVYLTASQMGKITFRVEHATAVIKTYYTGLQPRFEGPLNADEHRHNKASVKVDVRKLSCVLTHTHLAVETASLYLTDNAALVLNISIAPQNTGTVTFYVPVILGDNLEDNEEDD
jgi:HUS1 checkpoint protein